MGTVMAFSQAISTLDDFSRQQALEQVFGKFQYARLGALFENISREGSQAQQVISTLGYSTEELAKSAEKELSTVEQAFSIQLISAIEKLKLAIAPIGQLFTKMAIPIVNFLTRVVEWFNKLPEGVKNFAALATVITGLLIPAATMMFGLFANLIGTLAKMGQSITMLGITLLRKGPLAAIKSLTESGKYLSLSEIDAANAARQLGSATSFANEALLRQVGSANNAKLAIDNLTLSYQRLIAQQVAAKNTQTTFFATGAAASELSKNAPASKKILRRNKGGKVFSLNQGNIVPGSGNTDTVPAMLTPGEFVVNKQATKNNVGLLSAINAQRYNKGGGVANAGKMFYGIPDQYTYEMFIRQNGLNFSGGRHQGNIDKTSFQQLRVLFDQYTKSGMDESKIIELGKAARSFQDSHPENRLKTKHLTQMAVNLGLTTSSKKNDFFKGKGLSKPNAAHTTAPKIVTVKNWMGYNFSNTGLPVQELTNSVIKLNADTNGLMRGQGVPASQLLKEIQGTGLNIFDYLDAQFEQYLNFETADSKTGRKKYTDAYRKAIPRTYSSLIEQLQGLGDTLITDSLKPNTVQFESLYKKATQPFNSIGGGVLNSFYDEVQARSNQRAPRIQDLVQFFEKNNAIKEYATNKGIDLQKILDGEDGAKGKQLWRILLEANGHDVSNPQARQGFWKKILTKDGQIQQSTVGKIGARNRLAYHGTKMLSVIKKRGGLKGKGSTEVAFANKGGIAKQISKAMGLNADDALGAFGLRVPTPRTGTKPVFGKNSRMKDVFENPNYKDGIYLVSPDGGVPYEAWLFNNNGRLRMQRMGSYNTGSGLNTRTSQYDWVDVDPDMRANVYTRNEYTGSNVSSPIKAFNKGNIVPGSGNTDTVPAMLTPGEFVVNKQATKNNLGLLHSINSQKLNVGGVVNPPNFTTDPGFMALNRGQVGATSQIGGAMPKGMVKGAGPVGMIAGLASQAPIMAMYDTLGPMNSMIASMVSWSAASKLATVAFNKVTGNSKILAEQAKIAGVATGKLGPKALLTTKVLGLAAGSWLTIGTSVVTLGIVLNNLSDKVARSGAEFVNSMYGSSETMAGFAESMGRENIQQKLSSRRAEVAGGAEISPESEQFSSKFLETAFGQGLLNDAKNVERTRGSSGRDQAILNQLLRGIVTQSMTAEEAKAVAIDMGKKLNDQGIGIRISAQINRLVGSNGEDLVDNLLNIGAIITPKIDAKEAERVAIEQWQSSGIWSRIAASVLGRGTDEMIAQTIAKQAVEAGRINREQLDLIKYELEQGSITIQEFITKKDVLTKQSFETTAYAISELTKQFGSDTDKATKAIEAFRNEINKGFEIKISGLDEVDRKRVQDFINKFEVGGEYSTGISPLGTQTQTGFQPLGTSGISPLGTQTQTGFEPIGGVKVNEIQAGTLKELLDAETISALSKIEDIDVTRKLEQLFVDDPTLITAMEEYFTLGGNLSEFLSKSTEEMQKYKTALDQLSSVSEKFKEGLDITSLIADPDKLSEFTKKAIVAQEALDYLATQKNITKEVAMNVITTYLGDNATAKKLLEHYLSTGNKFEDLNLNALITMSVTNPQVAAALALIEQAKAGENVGMSALSHAYGILSKEGKTAGAGMQQGPGVSEGGEDPLKSIKDQIADTNTLISASQKLIASGLRPEIAATLSAAEAKALLAKKSGDLIKKLNEEADKSKVLANIYKDPRQVAIDSYNKQIEFIDRTIGAIDRQISAIRRKNELDQRDIGIRQRALESITKKEKEVNDQYNLRFESLNRVSKINDRITQQTQDRISLSSALVSGDFGAAASAAASMTGNFASTQVEDARVALELQRDQEIANIGALVNGQLMTKEQIEASIDVIQERMYQRDQQILSLQNQIYSKEEQKYLLQQNVQLINDQIAEQTARQTAKMAEQVGVAESLRRKLFAQYEIAKAIAQRNWGAKFGSYNTGGEVQKFTYGGSVYRGSKEPPPALRMAMGSTVPGMGLSDKVPALLTPGEFVVRKSVAQANMPLLNALNGNIFPNIGSFSEVGSPEVIPNNTVSNVSSPVYNYNVNVNVPNTTASPNEIADVVINRIRMSRGQQIRSNRF